MADSAGGGKKLSAQQAVAIAENIVSGERHFAIAQRFGVSVETVGAIKSGKRWADAVDDELRARMASASAGRTLDEVAARGVMAALIAGRSGRSIAEEFGISASMVSAIGHGRAWAHLDPDLPARLAAQPRKGKALTESQVAAIKHELLSGVSARKVAATFGVSASAVQAISQGKTWSSVAPREGGRSE